MDWEARFQQEDTPWERGDVHPAAKKWFSEKISGGPRLIIPGCGRSREPLHCALLGYKVLGVDLSATATKWQQDQFQSAGQSGDFATGDLLQWAPPAAADAIYEQTCLCAIAPANREPYARQVHSWLKPGGILYANFMQRPGEPGGPPFHCPMEEMKNLFPSHKWDWLDERPIRADRTGENHELGYRLQKR